MPRRNDEVARLLGELAKLTEIDEGSPQAFRVRAYDNARRAVEQLTTDVSGLSAGELAGVKGIGKSIAGRIREYVDTGTIGKLEELRDKHPVGKLELLRIPGLGAKSVELLASELGVTDLAGLEAALENGRIAELPGMGRKTADNLRRSIGQLELSSKQTRIDLYVAVPTAERIVTELRGVDGVVDAAYAGSVRRFKEKIGDLDVLVATDDPAPVTAAFLDLGDIETVLGSGETKSSVLTREGLQVDLRVVPPESFGAALLYFTGSKAHNIRLRQRALRRGLTLNEYALARLPQETAEAVADEAKDQVAEPADDTEDQAVEPSAPPEVSWRDLEVVAQRSEEEIYAALDLPWIPAELREDDGEIEQGERDELPRLVTRQDLRGDLHDHTDRSGDGRDPLEDLVAGAVERGHEYLAITDHAEDLTINGISRDEMLAQREQLRELEQQRGDIRLLHGAELNIGVDGSLDYDDEFLAGFDWLVASVHSHFSRGVEEQTRRILAAIRHPSVTAIGHLQGRMLGKRPGIELDLDAVLDAAAETGTAIEINANLRRLDANAQVIREGGARGVNFVISTDAHAVHELDNLRHGVANARRGRLDRDRVANTWPLPTFESWIEDVRS